MNYNFYDDLIYAYGVDIDENTKKVINFFKSNFDFLNNPKLIRNQEFDKQICVVNDKDNMTYVYITPSFYRSDNYFEIIKYENAENSDSFFYLNSNNKRLEGHISSNDNIIFIKFLYKYKKLCLSYYERNAANYVTNSKLDFADERNYSKCGISPDIKMDVPYNLIQDVFKPDMCINEYYDQLFELMNKQNKKLELKPNN